MVSPGANRKHLFVEQAEGYVKAVEKSTSPLSTRIEVLDTVLRMTRQAERGSRHKRKTIVHTLSGVVQSSVEHALKRINEQSTGEEGQRQSFRCGW